MRHLYKVMAVAFLASVFVSIADIQRIKEGGVSIEISDVLTHGEPAVLVFHTPWDQTSVNLTDAIESWAANYSDLTIIFIDVVDPRTQVYRQFSLTEIPSIIVFNRQHEQVGGILTELDDLEAVLRDNRII